MLTKGRFNADTPMVTAGKDARQRRQEEFVGGWATSARSVRLFTAEVGWVTQQLFYLN